MTKLTKSRIQEGDRRVGWQTNTLPFDDFIKGLVFSFSAFPSLLEVMGFIFYFGGVIAGPSFFYSDYIDFITGENYKCKEANNVVS